MAAALFRRGPGLCFRCIHRELCRVVWRPQAALFSSKPSDRKLPRRTHIKKAKPQPAVDVAKLLEQLFSQRRPGTAPPAAGKAKPAKASSNPPTTSSVKVFTSNVPRLSKTEPADSVSPAASTVSKKTTSTSNTAPRPPQPKSATSANPKTSFSSETPKQFPLGIIQDITSDGVSGVTVPPTSTMPASSGSEAATVECQPPAETRETKVETAAEADELTAAPVLPLSAYMVEKNVEKSFVPAATGEPLIETTTEPSVEASLPPVETLETKASADEGPVEPIIDIAVDTAHQEVQITSTDSVEPSIETTIEPSVDTGITPRVTLDSIAAVAEGTVEPTIESEERVVDILFGAKEEALIETTLKSSVEASFPPAGALETGASAEGPVASTVDAAVDASTEDAQAKSIDLGVVKMSHSTTVEPLLETTIDPSVEVSAPPVETLETRASVAEGAVETTIETKADIAVQAEQTKTLDSNTATVEFLLESTVEPTVEPITSPPQSQAAVVEGTVEPTIETEGADHLPQAALIQNSHESKVFPLKTEVESTTESIVEPSSGNVAVEKVAGESEQMTLESVTLHSVVALVKSLKTDELAQTKFILDEKAGRRLEELLSVRTGVGAEHKAAAEAENSTEDESETSTKVLSKWDSLSEDLQELEGETDSLMKELLCHVPAALSKPPATVKTSSASDQPVGVSGDSSLQMEEKAGEEEAMTLESITLAEVNAEVGDLETEVLQETSNALEKEANLLAKEEKMEVETAIEDVVFEDTTEAEILTLESISEATDAIEAETSVMLEAMFGSEQGLTQSPDTLTPGPQNEMIGRGAETESGEQEGGVSEAVSLESVTLAEVEASFATLEDQSLSETTAYLESEAEILAGKRKKEEGELAASDDMIEDVNVESRSLPEADGLSEDLQTDALMEELLFTVPGHVAGITEPQRLINILDAAVATGSEGVDTAATDASGFPASPALKEVLLEQELVEEGAQTEALGNEGGTGTHTDLDPVQRLVLEKIREYNNMRRLSVGPVGAGPDYERYLSEETAKLQRLYGGGDLGIFPQFTFTEPEMDQDST
uniref:ATP synthase peripheral stalk subunit F6, mitochondrial n=1 Tax=Seriola dumerili TaxID=41447 RepID=A0A3B4UM63_SERDU